MLSILALTARLARLGDELLPLMARLIFAAVLLVYYWRSGVTKLGEGIFGLFQPSSGAYVQIFPRTMEAAGYDVTQLSFLHWITVVAGTAAEFALPAMIVLGLLTRLSALGMIGFIVVQSVVDVVGHRADSATIGAWFDASSAGLILDQRAFWVLSLAVLVFKGAGLFSADRILFRNAPSARRACPQPAP